mmetsp:Transcript_83529/g.259472  ORF Transcript_83529/g.259472 Transcript_83529/m.259472 type:complete len:450 (+) Transcript_83529:124-1473(+)
MAAPDPAAAERATEFQELTVSTIDPKVVAEDDGPPDLNENGLRKVLKAYVVHEEPRITVIPGFVTDAEIEHLIELAEEDWVPSVVGSGVYKTNDESKDLVNKPSSNRTSYSCMLRSAQTARVLHIEQRLAHLAGIDVNYLERLNMVRYSAGQLFNRHHDGRFRPKTVFIYLNDLPEGAGGETLFPEIGVQIVPRKGCAVMWANVLSPGVEDSRTYHQGLPPRMGMKYGVNCFFNDKPLKQFEDADGDADGDTLDATRVTVDPAQLLRDASGSLQPGQIRAFTVHRDPRLSVVPEFLLPDEAAALRAISEPGAPSQAELEELYPMMEKRIALVAGLPLSHMERLRVAKCEQFMIPDGHAIVRGDYSKKFGCKVVYIFLNDVDSGGELTFPALHLQVKPREGCAVVWPVVNEHGEEDLRAAHQGRPPSSGCRHAAIAIFRSEPVRGVPPRE